jgi:hypothetical protein
VRCGFGRTSSPGDRGSCRPRTAGNVPRLEGTSGRAPSARADRSIVDPAHRRRRPHTVSIKRRLAPAAPVRVERAPHPRQPLSAACHGRLLSGLYGQDMSRPRLDPAAIGPDRICIESRDIDGLIYAQELHRIVCRGGRLHLRSAVAVATDVPDSLRRDVGWLYAAFLRSVRRRSRCGSSMWRAAQTTTRTTRACTTRCDPCFWRAARSGEMRGPPIHRHSAPFPCTCARTCATDVAFARSSTRPNSPENSSPAPLGRALCTPCRAVEGAQSHVVRRKREAGVGGYDGVQRNGAAKVHIE